VVTGVDRPPVTQQPSPPPDPVVETWAKTVVDDVQVGSSSTPDRTEEITWAQEAFDGYARQNFDRLCGYLRQGFTFEQIQASFDISFTDYPSTPAAWRKQQVAGRLQTECGSTPSPEPPPPLPPPPPPPLPVVTPVTPVASVPLVVSAGPTPVTLATVVDPVTETTQETPLTPVTPVTPLERAVPSQEETATSHVESDRRRA
jgi:hypothetical protein